MCVGPTSPPKPPPPPPPPVVEPSVQPTDGDSGEDAQIRRRARVQASGRSSTLWTTPSGILGEPNIGRTTLLGG
tara:strand:+ start:4714 stop:4935 length:222 start_codon:yes stop_codon:yes gene_type:complete